MIMYCFLVLERLGSADQRVGRLVVEQSVSEVHLVTPRSQISEASSRYCIGVRQSPVADDVTTVTEG